MVHKRPLPSNTNGLVTYIYIYAMYHLKSRVKVLMRQFAETSDIIAIVCVWSVRFYLVLLIF